mmetsp:Transcript_30829/g.51235  ORF Transcript_30829/g.51235 Transcript_30829/m.51235 type:complete len:222 (+) Transcript_30829:268-933(+)
MQIATSLIAIRIVALGGTTLRSRTGTVVFGDTNIVSTNIVHAAVPRGGTLAVVDAFARTISTFNALIVDARRTETSIRWLSTLDGRFDTCVRYACGRITGRCGTIAVLVAATGIVRGFFVACVTDTTFTYKAGTIRCRTVRIDCTTIGTGHVDALIVFANSIHTRGICAAFAVCEAAQIVAHVHTLSVLTLGRETIGIRGSTLGIGRTTGRRRLDLQQLVW